MYCFVALHISPLIIIGSTIQKGCSLQRTWQGELKVLAPKSKSPTSAGNEAASAPPWNLLPCTGISSCRCCLATGTGMNLAGRERLAAVENVKKVGGCCSHWASLSIRPEGAYPMRLWNLCIWSSSHEWGVRDSGNQLLQLLAKVPIWGWAMMLTSHFSYVQKCRVVSCVCCQVTSLHRFLITKTIWCSSAVPAPHRHKFLSMLSISLSKQSPLNK